MEEKQLSEFLDKYSKNQHSQLEHEQFVQWTKTLPHTELVSVLDRYQALTKDAYAEAPPLLVAKIEHRLDQLETLAEPIEKVSLWPTFIKIAAACIVLVGIGFFLSKKSNPNLDDEGTHIAQHVIASGGNKAILKLANGTEIVLDSAKLGKLTSQNGTDVIKADNGQVLFAESGQQQVTDPNAYNFISIPRGGQYAVVLPDGSKVWLNSASSLKFPAKFANNERLVEVTGEAYFEVAKDRTKPFRVKTATQTIEVLGTHFNVNAYHDEPFVATTLMEGSVKIVPLSGATRIIKPGQQARMGSELKIVEVDADMAIDWKNGNFKFSDENIQHILRKVSRWYDVDIVYKGNLTQEGFVGTVPRSKDINEVLNTLKLTGLINYKIEGKQVTITP